MSPNAPRYSLIVSTASALSIMAATALNNRRVRALALLDHAFDAAI
jgi:hypothetical protein